MSEADRRREAEERQRVRELDEIRRMGEQIDEEGGAPSLQQLIDWSDCWFPPNEHTLRRIVRQQGPKVAAVELRKRIEKGGAA